MGDYIKVGLGDYIKVVKGEHDIKKSRVAISTVVYGSEIWSLSVQEKRKIEVFEMMCLGKHTWQKESGQSKKLTNKRGASVS